MKAYLYLNVWTPTSGNTQPLPVIVWLPGGGFRVGAGSHPGSDGEKLGSRGAVVVTVNYRLNALGGDTKRVTLMGQSAGAMIVSALMAAPAVQGLFHRHRRGGMIVGQRTVLIIIEPIPQYDCGLSNPGSRDPGPLFPWGGMQAVIRRRSSEARSGARGTRARYLRPKNSVSIVAARDRWSPPS